MPNPEDSRDAGAPARGGRDRDVLYLGRTLRAFGAGALSVALALDLAAIYPPLVSGVILALSLGFASAWSFAAERLERRIGRRRSFLVAALGWSASGWLLFAGLPVPIVLALALATGGVLAGASDVGPLPALEQAALGAVVPETERTPAFGRYNFLGYIGLSVGTLAAAPLTGAGRAIVGSGHDLVLLLYGAVGLGLLPVYRSLSPDADRLAAPGTPPSLSTPARRRILTLSGLFSVDAFGGGLVANFLVTLWLRERFGASGFVIGATLSAAMVGAAVSLLLAVPLARRIGLVPTMVFTHLPSSVLLVLFAFAPSLPLAALLWVGRSVLSQMDVPTRQSFVQGIVSTEERTAAAGYTTAARSSAALGGPVTGAFLGLGGPWLSAPFVLAGCTKIAYDAALFSGFRRVRAVDERGR